MMAPSITMNEGVVLMSSRSLVFCLLVSLILVAVAAAAILLFSGQSSVGWSLLLVGLLIGFGACVQAGLANNGAASKWATVPAQVKQS